MTPYLLISLYSPSDEASLLAHGLACYLNQQHPPVLFAAGEHPEHAIIGDAVCELALTPPATGVVFGHGGSTLRAQQQPEPIWCTPQQFGALFPGARVYVFACRTAPDPNGLPFFRVQDTFGEAALLAGIQVYVGHYLSIGVPEPPPRWTLAQQALLQQTTAATIRAFLDGEERATALKQAIYDGIAALEEECFTVSDELPTPPDPDGATDWGAAASLRQIARSLRVGRRREDGPSWE